MIRAHPLCQCHSQPKCQLEDLTDLVDALASSVADAGRSAAMRAMYNVKVAHHRHPVLHSRTLAHHVVVCIRKATTDSTANHLIWTGPAIWPRRWKWQKYTWGRETNQYIFRRIYYVYVLMCAACTLQGKLSRRLSAVFYFFFFLLILFLLRSCVFSFPFFWKFLFLGSKINTYIEFYTQQTDQFRRTYRVPAGIVVLHY